MKVFWFHPNNNAQRDLVKALQGQGTSFVLESDPVQAFRVLQAQSESWDLVVLHREGKDGKSELGFEILRKLKKDAGLSDLPVIVTSSVWGDPQFAEHQKKAEGAHAYLRFPFSAQAFKATVAEILGENEGPELSLPTAHETGVQLESATGFFIKPDPGREASMSSIHLELPDLPDAGHEPSLIATPPMTAAPEPESQVVIASEPEKTVMTAVDSSYEFTLMGNSDQGVELAANSPAESGALPPLPQPARELDLPAEALSLDAEPPKLPTGESEEAPRPAEVESPSELNLEQADLQGEEALPYLYAQHPQPGAPRGPSYEVSPPFGDAVVPGGAAQSPDIETLKKYLFLREQDVVALSKQLKTAREQTQVLQEQLHQERALNTELQHRVQEQEKRISGFTQEKEREEETLRSEIAELKFEVKARTDKAKAMEASVKDAQSELDRLKERVRLDIRKIRVRERELENRLEILKKDSEILIAARESKIIELKRRVDLLEFNSDLLQDKFNKEKESGDRLRERLNKAAQVVRVVSGLLDARGAAQLNELADGLATEGADGGGHAA